MKRIVILALLAAGLAVAVNLRAAENLRLNQRLDYSSDSQDGPLITGDHIENGAVRGKPNYVFMFGEGWFNSKRQARRSVNLYQKYKGKVQFVIIDLDKTRPAEQQQLVRKYYKGYIPHVVILDASGNAVYDKAGEITESDVSHILDRLSNWFSRSGLSAAGRAQCGSGGGRLARFFEVLIQYESAVHRERKPQSGSVSNNQILAEQDGGF
jgi:hypothetical protein